MKPKSPDRQIRYPYSTRAVYLSVVLAGLSVVFTLLLLGSNPVLLLGYAAFTALITLIAFLVKVRIFFLSPRSEDDSSQYMGSRTEWRKLILLFLLITAAIFLPIALAYFISYSIWFTILAGFVSGVSISEICLYLYSRRGLGNSTRKIQANGAD